jgi:hypothetical protein
LIQVYKVPSNSDTFIEPLMSRFLILEVPDYSFEEFTNIAVKRLANEKVDRNIAPIIAEKVWYELGSRDVRDVIKIGRVVDNIQDISLVIKMMKNKT